MRGGRGRGGLDSTRGGRGRGDRGRGGARGGRGGAITSNGPPRDDGAVSVPTTESGAWGTTTATDTATAGLDSTPAATTETANQGGWRDVVTADATPATASEGAKSTLLPDGGPKKTWASMFAQPKPVPAIPKPSAAAPQLPAELANPSAGSALAEAPPMDPEASVPSVDVEPAVETEAEPAQEPVQEPVQEQEPIVPAVETTNAPAEAALSAPQAPLTEDNVENLPDVSQPPATHTAASTVGSLDPRTITPLVPGQQAPIGRPPIGGFASSAYRATAVPGRSASYQRRVLDQQEAVVMPGHNAVDRAAVQFGSMGLSGDSEGLDVDEEREEPETRTQPPQQSPAQPRASLPPAPVHSSTAQQDMGLPESLLTPKPAPGLGAPSHQHQQQTFGLPHENAAAAPQVAPQDSFSSQQYSQYGRYGQPETSAPSQKSYDPFSHQTPSSAFDQYSSQQSQPSSQQQGYGAFSSAPSDYSHYYTADQQRNAYQNYYGSSYGQQNAQSQQDGGAAQRTSSSIGASASESAFQSAQGTQQVGPTIPLVSALMQRDLQQRILNSTPEASRFARRISGAFENSNKENSSVLFTAPSYVFNRANSPSQAQSRYNDTQGSGQDSSLMGGQQQGAAQSHQMHQQQQQQQHQAHAAYNSAYPYGHPYYQSPYQTAYQNQFGYSGGYGGAPYGSKGGMYAQPQHYGMNAPSAYEQHASSPATGGFGQQSSMQSRDTGLGGGSLGEYGRTPSSQPAGLGSGGGGSFGASDPFARTHSGYGGHTQSYGQQQSQNYGQQQSAPSEELKPFGESKATGPSPALGQPGRPGSATNSVGNQSQSGLPPQQSHQQQGFGGYPGFNQGSQYGGLGGLGGHQAQQGQQGAYGGAYGGGFGNSYSQAYGRGGWGGNYGH